MINGLSLHKCNEPVVIFVGADFVIEALQR